MGGDLVSGSASDRLATGNCPRCPRYQGGQRGGTWRILTRQRGRTLHTEGRTDARTAAMVPEPRVVERVALSVREVAELLGVHRNTVYL